MSDKSALDLSSIDPPIWRIMVEDVVYGPYTMGQMRSFAEEGRLLESSQVAYDDGGAFLNARMLPELCDLFLASPPSPKAEFAPEPANYLVSVQTDADGRRAVISLLNEIGRFSELMPGCFCHGLVYFDNLSIAECLLATQTSARQSVVRQYHYCCQEVTLRGLHPQRLASPKLLG